MLKILQTSLQQYLNHEFPDIQAGFRKGIGTRDQIANIHWFIEKNITNTLAATATAAKSLQSCSTLCNPIDGSPPGSPVPGILQARVLEWGAIAFSSLGG